MTDVRFHRRPAHRCAGLEPARRRPHRGFPDAVATTAQLRPPDLPRSTSERCSPTDGARPATSWPSCTSTSGGIPTTRCSPNSSASRPCTFSSSGSFGRSILSVTRATPPTTSSIRSPAPCCWRRRRCGAPDDPDQTLVTYTAEPGSPSQEACACSRPGTSRRRRRPISHEAEVSTARL